MWFEIVDQHFVEGGVGVEVDKKISSLFNCYTGVLDADSHLFQYVVALLKIE